MRLSDFIIGLVLVSAIVAGIALFVGEVNNKYPRTDYNTTEFDSFNKLSELTNQAQQMENRTAIKKDENLFDVIGGYVSSGYQALRFGTQSITTFYDISQTAVEKTGIPHLNIVRTALIVIVLILIFIGIMLNVILHQSDRI